LIAGKASQGIKQYVHVPVKVIRDRRTGKSTEYGFVQFSSENEAATALQEMDGKMHLFLHYMYIHRCTYISFIHFAYIFWSW